MPQPSAPRRFTLRYLAIAAGAAVLLSGGAPVALAQSGHGSGPIHGMDGAHLHDEATMPGLLGANASPQESAEIEMLFRNFQTLSREVENLPNGIRTVTRSSDPAVMDALISHSVGMIDRVARLDDPQIIIQSPTLDLFFVRGETIENSIEVTDDGLVVIQTSDDPEMVAALQVHAAEVTAMVERGMQAVHEMMMARGQTH